MAENEGVSNANAPRIAKDDIEFDAQNPNVARAIPRGQGRTLSERIDANLPRARGTYPDIVEGSDSRRTGTNWGVLGVESEERVETPTGSRPEGESRVDASPNRNTGEPSARDALRNTGSWSTIDTDDSAGSPSGNS